MDTKQVTLVQESFEKVAALGEAVAHIFYGELFALDPSLRPLFKGDMATQRQKLLAALALVIRSLHTPEKIVAPVQQLAVRHLDYGVRPEHYATVGDALLRTLQKGLGAAFTAELRAAWSEAYQTLASMMVATANSRVAHKGAAA